MKVVYVSLNFLPAGLRGSEQLTYQFAKSALQIEGTQVTVITSKVKHYIGYFLPFIGRFSKKEEIIEGIKVKRLPHYWSFYTIANCVLAVLLLLRKLPLIGHLTTLNRLQATIAGYAYGVVFKGLLRALIEEDPDIVHVTPIPQIYVTKTIKIIAALNKQQRKQIKLILTPAMHFHAAVVEKTYPFKETKMLFELVDTIICTTQFEKEKIQTYFSIKSEKISLIPIGYSNDTKKVRDVFSPNIRNPIQLCESQRKKGGMVILFMGTRCEKKGVYNLLKAVKRLPKKEQELLLVLVGGQITLSWRIFSFFAICLHSYPFLVNLPFVSKSEKQLLFQSADVFAMPSIVDSYGIVYIEAMAAGLPIIACTEPPQIEIIQSAGLFSDFGDRKVLSSHIQLLFKQKKLRKEKGKKAFSLYNEFFSEKTMFEKLNSIYQEVLTHVV